MMIWCVDYSNSRYTDATMQDLSRFRGIKFFRGAKLKGQFPSDATVVVRTKRAPTDSFRAGVFWVISERLRQILESHGVAAEYFSVRLVDTKGNSIDGSWWCFNPTLVLDWFDWTNSEYVKEQDFATEIKSVRAKNDILQGVPLAVAERTIPVLFAVSKELAETIIKNSCTGIVFREPNQWTNPKDPVGS